MESRIAEHFLSGFDDGSYPAAFTDRYEAMECLSSGRHYETLLVRERASGRLLVAKCYEKTHHLFESTEPEMLHSLSHPGLPAFVEELRSATMRCILREYVEGRTLCELKPDHDFSPDTVRSIGLALCGILQYLHSRVPPVIHRDIKPQNVVIRRDGSVALIDLGISRLYVEGARSDTVFCGTQDFAPPEQYGFMQTDSRSDIYSLGSLLAWMLTGKAEPIQAPHTPLEKLIAKCSEFIPAKRFRDAAAVEWALLGTYSVIRKKKRVGLGIALLLALSLLIFTGLPWLGSATASTFSPAVSKSGFTEPLIEEAVRLMLGKEANDPITSEELSSVTELYITYDTVCPDEETFFKIHEEQCSANFNARGPITSLKDLQRLPNLSRLFIASEQITDITPLESLTNLCQVELRFNSISDITPLAGLENLNLVGLNSNPVTDISPLADCKNLRNLDLCNANDYDGIGISLLGDLDFLDISNKTDSYLYLGEKQVTDLKLSFSGMTDLFCLHDVQGLKYLEICETQVTDLSELAVHPEITYLRLCEIPAQDYSVLLDLPALEEVCASACIKDLIEPVAAEGAFQVTYQ